MLFERCHTENRKISLKQHITYFNFLGKIQLDHPAQEGRKLAKVELDEKTAKKLGTVGINLASKNSWCAAHHAASNGIVAVVKVLARYGADLDKQLNTFYDKLTPMMLAAAMGHLDIVEFLYDHAKAAKKDRYRL